MKVGPIAIRKLFKENEDLYEKVIVSARRQRQIIDSRSLIFEAFQDIEDTEDLDRFDEIDHQMEKPMALAMEELLDDELDWNYDTDEEE